MTVIIHRPSGQWDKREVMGITQKNGWTYLWRDAACTKIMTQFGWGQVRMEIT